MYACTHHFSERTLKPLELDIVHFSWENSTAFVPRALNYHPASLDNNHFNRFNTSNVTIIITATAAITMKTI